MAKTAVAKTAPANTKSKTIAKVDDKKATDAKKKQIKAKTK